MIALKMGCEIKCLTTVKTQKAGIYETIDYDIVAHGSVHGICLPFDKLT